MKRLAIRALSGSENDERCNPTHPRASKSAIGPQWGDCDPAGIVYFPRYFEIFDACTAAAFEAVGYPKPLLLRTFGIIGIPAVDIRATFSAPCTFGDDVIIETRIADWGRSSFKVHHRLLKGPTAAVEGFEVRVWTGRDPGNPAVLRGEPIPREVTEKFVEVDVSG